MQVQGARADVPHEHLQCLEHPKPLIVIPGLKPRHCVCRYEERGQSICTDSYLEDVFDTFSNAENEMGADAYDAACRDWGATKGEIVFHYRM